MFGALRALGEGVAMVDSGRTRFLVPLIWVGNLVSWGGLAGAAAWGVLEPPRGVPASATSLALGIPVIAGILGMTWVGDVIVKGFERRVELHAPGRLDAHDVSPDIRLEQSLGGLKSLLDISEEPAVAANPDLAGDIALLRAVAHSKSWAWRVMIAAVVGIAAYAVVAVTLRG